jgi:VWFA-related protein
MPAFLVLLYGDNLADRSLRLSEATTVTNVLRSHWQRSLRTGKMRIRNLVWLAASAFLLLAGSGLSQQPPASDQPKPSVAGVIAGPSDLPATPTFKSRAELALVPVVVRDKHGKYLAGLPKDAFRLEENGKEQGIVSFDEVRVEKSEMSASPTTDGSYSNLPLDATQHLRVTIVVLDMLNTSLLQQTDFKEQLIKFFSKDLHNGEPISLLCITRKGVQLIRPFTTDTDLLVRSLRDLKVEGPRLGQRIDVVRKTLEQLRQIAHGYSGVPGRKTLIWGTGDIPDPDGPTAARFYGGSGIINFQETWSSLLSANIAVYPVGLLSWSSDPAFMPRAYLQSLHSFADATGGNLCVESKDFEQCLAEAVDDSRFYYMLSYSVKPEDRKPGWRNLKVKVAGEHGEVRARERFYYESPSVSTNVQAQHQDEIVALASPLAASGVRMNVRVLKQASAAAGSSGGGKTTIPFVITIPLESVTFDSSRDYALDLEVGAIALDKDMKEAGEFLHPVRGNPKPETVGQFAREGIRLDEKLALSAGTYDLRFVVRDNSTGQIGTVVFPLDVK